MLKDKTRLSPSRLSPRCRRDYNNYINEKEGTMTDDESDGQTESDFEDFDTTRNASTSSPTIQCSTHSQMYIIIAIAVLLGLLTCTSSVFSNSTYVEQNSYGNRLLMLNECISKLKLKFHNQAHGIWTDIVSGMHDAIVSKKPGIIILFGDKTETIKCLAHSLGNISSSTYGTYSYLTLKPQDFQNDVGEVIHELKDKISQKKAVVIENLLAINPEALKAFHNFCDRENPLVHEAVYIITMTIGKHNTFPSNLRTVENEITKNFIDKIDKDMLDPIVTRITDGAVVSISPEVDLNGC